MGCGVFVYFCLFSDVLEIPVVLDFADKTAHREARA